MEKILDNEQLILQYKWGFGAWTYHLRIPNTAHLDGKWGLLLIKPPDSLGVPESFSGVFLTKKAPSGRIKVQSVNCA